MNTRYLKVNVDSHLQQTVEPPPVVHVFRRLIVKQEMEDAVVHFSVHDHGFEHWSLADDKLYHAIDQAQLRTVHRDHDCHLGLVDQTVVTILLIRILEMQNNNTVRIHNPTIQKPESFENRNLLKTGNISKPNILVRFSNTI